MFRSFTTGKEEGEDDFLPILEWTCSHRALTTLSLCSHLLPAVVSFFTAANEGGGGGFLSSFQKYVFTLCCHVFSL